MKDYNYKIVDGSAIRGEYLKLARAKAIFKAAEGHPFIKDVLCFVNGKGDEIIKMHMTHLEIPDDPINNIHDEEEVAIICHPEDINIPEVFALRKDFPLELPHSNAKPFAHPVSLCVSDISFTDIRPLFNAHDFLNYIRRWFSLNSINKLHEANRPLEVFFGYHEVCCILNNRVDANPYVLYLKKTKLSSTLEFVEKSKASHYWISIPTEKIYANNFVRIPQTMGDLRSVKSTDRYSLTDSLLAILTNTVAGKATLPLVISVYIHQTSEDNKKKSNNLFLIKTDYSPREIIHKKFTLGQNGFEQWFYGLPVEVILLDLMVSRLENSINNGIKELFNKVSIIGTGTLGSAVIDHFVREGCAEEVVILDYDILFPHNLSRHILPTDKVMTSKVRSIRDSYRGILDQKLTAIESNMLTLSSHDKERVFKDAQLVMDFSTSVAVERKLAKDDARYRRCTSFLNPKGDDIVLFMEDNERIHRLDLLEMDYYRNLIVDHRFEQHLRQTGMVRTNNFSCRSESMILNYENVRALSAIVAQQIRKYYSNGSHCLNIWHIDTEDGTVTSLPMRVSEWSYYKQNGVEVFVSKEVESDIHSLSVAAGNKETGGCLFGSYDRDYNALYVYYMVKAPEDSVHTSMSFVRGFYGLTDEYNRISELTYHQVRYLGEWHSHPNMANTPSAIDKRQFAELMEEQQSQDLPFIQMIHGNNGLHVEAVM